MTSRAEKPSWSLGDYFDLSIIGMTHGLSDGFSSMLVPVLALIILDLGLSPFEAGALLSIFSFGGMIFQYPLSILADNTGRRKQILLAGMGLSAASFIAMIWMSGFWPLCVLAFFAGVGNSVYHPCGDGAGGAPFRARPRVRHLVAQPGRQRGNQPLPAGSGGSGRDGRLARGDWRLRGAGGGAAPPGERPVSR